LKHGADIDATDGEKSNPLHYAILSKNLKVIKLLVENNVLLNDANLERKTPLR
jgi:ankyrin repeat protein